MREESIPPSQEKVILRRKWARMKHFLLFFLISSWTVCTAEPNPFPNLVTNPFFFLGTKNDRAPYAWKWIPSPEDPPGPATNRRGLWRRRTLYIGAGVRGGWQSEIKGLEPGRYYFLRFWVKREGWRDGEYPYLRIFGREIRMNELFSWGGWRRVRYVLKAGEEQKTMVTFLSNGLSHGISIGGMELRKVAINSLRPIGGKTIRERQPSFSWNLIPSELVFRILVDLSRDLRFQKPITIERMSPQGKDVRVPRPLENGKWYWRVRVRLGAEEVARSKVQTFSIAHGNQLSEKGHYRAEPLYPSLAYPSFFPIGVYNGDTPETYKELERAGINSVLFGGRIDKTERLFREAAIHGLRAMIRVPYKREKKSLVEFVKRVSSSPSLLGWYLEDEPSGRGVAPLSIWRDGFTLRKAQSKHLTGLALLRSRRALYYGPAVNVVMVDPYPIPTQPLTWLSDSIEEVRRLLGPGKSIWAIIQAFSWGQSNHYPKGRPSRFPTFVEQRALVYLAIAHGVEGIFFFSEREGRQSVKHWEGVKRLAGELRCLSPVLLSLKKSSLLKNIGSERDEKGKPTIHFTVKDLKRTMTLPIRPGCPWLKRGRYLIAVNPTPKAALLSLNGFTPGERRAIEIFSGEKSIFRSGILREAFEPRGVRVWRLDTGK